MRLTRQMLAAALFATVALTGCDGSPRTERPEPSATATAGAASASGPSTDSWWAAPLLTEPEYTSKLVEGERRGRGETVLPAVTITGKEPVRLAVACSGPGNVTVLVNERDNGSRVQCDQVRTFVDVYAEPGEQRLALRSAPEVRWKVAVLQR